MHFKTRLTIAIMMAAGTILNSSDSRADLMVTIPHVTVAPGGSGFLDVLISSNALSISPDSFQNYFLDFVVSGPAQALEPISFVPSAIPAPQLTATGPDYVFLGNSLEANDLLGIDFVTDQAGAPVANDLITVLDETFDGADRPMNSDDAPFLLARLNFVAPSSATPGNVYDISLDFGDFQDTGSASYIPSSNVGSITISAAAVPEPSSVALLALGSLAWLGRRRRCRQRADSCDDTE